MTFGELEARAKSGDASVVADHRQVRSGAVFVAIRGHHVDARQFAKAAADQGAIAVVGEGLAPVDLPAAVVWVSVPNARRALSRLAAAAAGHPSEDLAITAVTGTNGKTTVTYLVEGIWRQAGKTTGRIGTVEVRYPGHVEEATLTTPDALLLQRILRAMRDAGVSQVAMEASSHALAQWRMADVRLACACLTNVARDHLDYHRTLAQYRAAKARLFRQLPKDGTAVLRLEDPVSEWFARRVRGEVIRYGLSAPADVRPEKLVLGPWGSAMRLCTPAGNIHVDLALAGRHALQNALAAATCAIVRGAPLHAVAAALATPEPVPGRAERIVQSGVTVLLDFAHNPDGLRAILSLARLMTQGRVTIVFGAEGDKDRGKRPLMGHEAARGADRVVVTSDNPRGEDPLTICQAVARGAVRAGAANVWVEPDRRLAIQRAIASAARGEVVVVAGRGPERVQIVGSAAIPLVDRQVIEEALAERRVSAATQSEGSQPASPNAGG